MWIRIRIDKKRGTRIHSKLFWQSAKNTGNSIVHNRRHPYTLNTVLYSVYCVWGEAAFLTSFRYIP